jgi:hypothetical protein
MGILIKKPFKQFSRATKEWVTVIPKPVDFKQEAYKTKKNKIVSKNLALEK